MFYIAAKKLFISQPALSNMVRKAEKEMGAPIFDRSTIPLTVTKEGAYYIRTVEKILFLERNLERYFQDIAGLQGGTLALGGASYFCSFVYPDLIARFQTKYPQVTIDLTEGNTRELKAGLENESLDLVLETAMEKDDTSIKRYLFRKENLILAVPESFPVNRKLQPYRLSRQEILSKSFLKPEVEAVPLKEFKDVPFITMKPGNDMYKLTHRRRHITPPLDRKCDLPLRQRVVQLIIDQPRVLRTPLYNIRTHKHRSNPVGDDI